MDGDIYGRPDNEHSWRRSYLAGLGQEGGGGIDLAERGPVSDRREQTEVMRDSISAVT